MQESGIYDRHNITQEALAGLDGNGTYVSVERVGNEILIRQDFTGCYGLYVYRDGGRFVISNSFLYLMEYMSRRARLTLNRDYANHFLIMGLSSMAYSETFINEIELLPRDVVVRIDIPSGTLSTERINYGENTVRLDSAEGMKILDEWGAKWGGIFRNVSSRTHNITVDLSGGFDSRMSFALLVNSGIDLSKVCVYSIKGDIYTFKQDYAIASEIAGHFGFTLNNMENFTGGELNYSVDDSISSAFYTRMFRHTQFPNRRAKYEDKRFQITGFSGESARAYWHPAENLFIISNKSGAREFSAGLKKELEDSLKRILKHLLEETSSRANIPICDDLAPHVFRETWGRSHFGATEAAFTLSNIYSLCPLADTGFNRLRLDGENCTDKNLLMAIIFTRFCPKLLEFRFTNDEFISYETLKYAREVCSRFPHSEARTESGSFSLAPRDPEVSALLEHNNTPLQLDACMKYLKEVFDSTAARKLFGTCFDEELYIYANEFFMKDSVHHQLAKCNPVTAAAEVIKHIIISEGTQERNISDDFREFAGAGFTSCHDRRIDRIIYGFRFIKRKGWRLITLPFRAVRKIFRLARREVELYRRRRSIS